MNNKFSINLLPAEFTNEQTKKTKFYKVQTISIGIILFMIFLAILTVSLRILQNGRISSVQTQAKEAEDKVTSLSKKQVSLLLLKNRLSEIDKNIGVASKQTQMYNLISDLVPASLVVTEISVGNDGNVAITALAPDVQTLDRLTSNLLDKDKNQGKISSLSIEALNRGRDALYRISMKIESNEK